MASNWRKSSWGEAISLEYGKGLRDYKGGDGSVRVFGTNGPVGWTNEEMSPGPGVIVGRKGAYRGVHYSDDPFYVIDTAYYVKPKTELDMRWIYYAIKFHKLTELNDGSPIPSTTRAAVYVKELEIPPIDEQKAIGKILTDFEDKIALNNRINQTLESTAEAIFKAWFVDFEPVKAKSLGHSDFKSMNKKAFENCPQKFASSELGNVPEGWDAVPIGDLVEVIGGGTPSTKNPEFWDGENPFCTPKDMSKLEAPVLLDTERHVTEKGVAKISSGQLPIGTVLLSSRAPIGYLALAERPVSINQGIIAMHSKEVPPSYIYFWTKQNMELIKSRAGGSTFAEISKSNFRKIMALKPDSITMLSFADLVSPLFEQIAQNCRENVTLSAILEKLVPQLLSGQVRVKPGNGRQVGK